MARLKPPYATTAQLTAAVMQERDLAYDTTLDRFVMGDGVAAAGKPLAFLDEVITVAPSGTDDTTTIQTALTAGYLVQLKSGATYYISSRLNITSAGSGLIGDGTPLIVMLADSGEFDNTSASAGDRYGTDAVGIYASSIARPIVKGVRIKYETQTDDRYVKAIAFRSCTDILIEEVEAWNFTKALGVLYVGACTGGSVSRNYVHDCTTNSATTGQITGIEFDNDDTLSSGIDVDGNRIENLTVGSTFLASWGYQTDGINVTKSTTKQLRIRGNHIKGVGEGIDHFGVDCEITDNHVEDCYYYGIKHVNGGSRTLTTTNTIRRCGLAGIVLAGSATVAQDTADNYIFGNDIYDIDPNGTFSGNTTAGILFAANGGTSYLPRRNHVCDNKIDCGANGKYGVYGGSSDGTLNFVLRNRVRNAATVEYSIHATCVPYFYTESAGNIATSGTIDPAQGADIASATTTNIGAATGNYLHITGTTTITGLGTVAAGIRRTVKFTGALTLTHNGTSLILPGSANITTAANDTAEFASLGSGNWVCLWYKRASGLPVVAPVSDTAYDATSWNGVTDIAPSKNAVRDLYEALLAGVSSSFDTLAEIATALGTKVTSGGALGTPASGTLTNCTGLPTTGLTGSVSVAQMGAAGYGPFQLSFVATGVNFNSANTDTAIPISLPTGFTRFSMNAVRICGADGSGGGSLTTATCGVFSAAAAGGSAFVASGSAITVTTSAEGTVNNTQALTVAIGGLYAFRLVDVPNIYFRVQNPQGAARTANVVVTIIPLP